MSKSETPTNESEEMKMFEFEIFHPEIQKSRIILGYTYADACRRSNIIDPEEWIVIYQYYID